MLKRGLAFCLVLSVASVARAGATIDLKPALMNGGDHNDAQNTVCYELGTAFDVIDVFIEQSPAGTARELRHAQLDFSASDHCPGFGPTCTTSLFLSGQPVHGSDRIWDFGLEAATCENDEDTTDPATCGDGHHFDTSFTGPAGRERVVSMTWFFVDPSDLNGDATYQWTLPASGSKRLGRIRVDLPTVAGNFTLDALNAAQTNADLGGADIRFGFGTDVTGGDGVALTTWRANFPPGDTKITGSPLTITMAEECGGPPPCTITLASSAPADQQSLWRSERNIFFLTFPSAVTVPPAGALKIEKITGGTAPNCTYSADLSSQFTMTLTNAVPPNPPGAANTVLQVRETPVTGGPLEHRAWYRVSYTGTNWTGVCPFSREYVVQVGDADGNRFVTAIDVGQVNASPGGVAPINSRFDIDGNGFRTAIDVGQANASQGGLPGKPCDPAPIP